MAGQSKASVKAVTLMMITDNTANLVVKEGLQ